MCCHVSLSLVVVSPSPSDDITALITLIVIVIEGFNTRYQDTRKYIKYLKSGSFSWPGAQMMDNVSTLQLLTFNKIPNFSYAEEELFVFIQPHSSLKQSRYMGSRVKILRQMFDLQLSVKIQKSDLYTDKIRRIHRSSNLMGWGWFESWISDILYHIHIN